MNTLLLTIHLEYAKGSVDFFIIRNNIREGKHCIRVGICAYIASNKSLPLLYKIKKSLPLLYKIKKF